MNMPPTQTPQASVPSLPSAIDDLHNLLSELEAKVSSLESRLAPVVSEAQNQISGVVGGTQSPVLPSSLVSSVNAGKSRVGNIIDRVESVLSRLHL